MITEAQTKELLTEILVEMMQTKREIFYEIFLEALEEFSLGQAINEGRQNNFVPEENVLKILDSIENESQV
jgi:hypothetical protein